MIKACIRAVFDVIKMKVVKRKFYAQLTAFAICALALKIDGEPEDLTPGSGKWNECKPTIYDLDKILVDMKDNMDFIRSTFKVDVSNWTRDDVRPFIEVIDNAHAQYSEVLGRDLSACELATKLVQWFEMPWRQLFSITYCGYAKCS